MVNTSFHEHEAAVYDEIHQAMWKSLPEHFSIISDRILATGSVPDSLSLLDIGCGTGLGTELLLHTEIGKRVREIHLLDTSSTMMDHAAVRSRNWPARTFTYLGGMAALPEDSKFDLVLASSVLHHIPNLVCFFEHVAGVQRPGSFFIHLQDPNGDYLDDPELRHRTALGAKNTQPQLPRFILRFSPGRILRRVLRELTGRQHETYIDLTNKDLLATEVITSPLTAEEIWSVTDVHLYDGLGISLGVMKKELTKYELIHTHSYAFFGHLSSDLPPPLLLEERRLLRNNAPNGMDLAAVWRRCNC